MLKRKGDKDSDGASTSRKSNQVGVVEQADENPELSQERKNIQMLGCLTRGAHTTYAQKGSGSVHTSLMMEALS